MRHIKQLDSLRAIAAMLVILWHWMPTDHFINTFDNGAIGVNIFFVLSGFLITRILLENRIEAEKLNNNKLAVFKNFYIRRALRIFPIYYLTIFLIWVFHSYLGAKFNTPEFIHSVTYTINFYFFKIKGWGNLTVHFWSLAVEEQFYLIWPFVILFTRKKYLVHILVFFISVGIVTQCLIKNQEFGYIPTYTCFDSFGLGGLLAWIILFKPKLLNRAYVVLNILSVLALIVLVSQIKYGVWPYFPQRTLHSIIALWLITYILFKHRKGSSSFFILNNKGLLFLGKISYGIYLYHVPVQWFQFILIPALNKYLPFTFVRQYNNYIIVVINFCLLIFISWLSWKIIEKPVLSLKKNFEYQSSVNSDIKKSKTIAVKSV